MPLLLKNMARFSIDLFKRSYSDSENSLISPLSVLLALAMAANGAEGETFQQMEALLGGDIPLDTLNEYLLGYVGSLPSEDISRLNIVNSIWFRDDSESLRVEPGFLQRNADYYGAAAFKSAFDDKTVKEINSWVELNTDGMIDAILDEIHVLDMLFLINAITFNAEWYSMYNERDVQTGAFTNISGEVRNVDFMRSAEYIYLDDGMAAGFIKPYANGGYSFAALLPNMDVSISAYVETLTDTGFLNMIESAKGRFNKVETFVPKFEFEYEIMMNETLAALGMVDAFIDSQADFRRMGTSPIGNLSISEVLHKTFILVDQQGTRAGAATTVRAEAQSPPIATVRLDRPFLFAIIDNATNLPVFIGTLLTV